MDAASLGVAFLFLAGCIGLIALFAKLLENRT
jgi:hypothetical protein